MSDLDAALPVRTVSTDEVQVQTKSGTKLAIKTNATTDQQTQLADSTGTLLNPAKEDGHLATVDTSTAAINTKLPATLGAKVSASSLAVVLASDQAALPVTISGDQGVNIDKVGNTTVTLGAKASTASIPVVLASDQAALPVTISGDQGVNIDKVGNTAVTLGSKASTASIPVVIASDQGTIPVSISGDQGVNIDKVNGTAVSLGAKVSASSFPVVLASDQASIPVSIAASSTVQKTAYNTAAAVAAAAQSIHSYTPAGTELFDGVDVAGSGEAKWEIQIGTTGSETTRVVRFTSKPTQNAAVRFPYPIQVTSAMTVKVIRTNMDILAQDLYSTILTH